MRNSLLAMTLLGTFGCSTTSNDAPPSSTVADSGTDAAAIGDATTASDTSAPDAAPAAQNLGFVFAISDSTATDGGTAGSYTTGAHFDRDTKPDPTVTSLTVGPCLVETFGSGTPPTDVPASAGIFHVSGGTKTVDVTPKSDGTYDPVSGATSLWSGGETLVVTGDGKDVPAFMTSLVAPAKLTLTAPAVAPSGLTVTRSMPFTATWSAATSNDVVLYFDTTSGSSAYSVTCTFKASDGMAQVPAAAFAGFPAGAGTFNFYAKASSTVTPAAWTVRFTATSSLVVPSGDQATGQVTFN